MILLCDQLSIDDFAVILKNLNKFLENLLTSHPVGLILKVWSGKIHNLQLHRVEVISECSTESTV